jgi:hypothetical protein
MGRVTREYFLKVYSNLPMKARQEPIVVIDGKPLTWNVAFIEVKNNTKMGTSILKMLGDIGIL